MGRNARTSSFELSRRELVAGIALLAAMPALTRTASAQDATHRPEGRAEMGSGYVTTDNGTQIFYKDWGPKDAQPIVFHHGWPLSSDDWDAQMLFFLAKGYRVVAHDRRGHGRSAQVDRGNDMDHYAADASAVVEQLDLRNAVHIGHSTGGGEVARYVAKHGQPQGRVAKAVLVSAVPPLMLKTEANPEGRRSKCSMAFARRSPPTGRSSISTSRRARSTASTGRREGLGGRDPELVASGHDGRCQGPLRRHQGLLRNRPDRRPEGDHRADAGPARRRRPGRADRGRRVASAKLLKNGTLKTYPGFPHGMLTTHADVINPDLLAFVKG